MLLVDFDPQGNATSGLGVDKSALSPHLVRLAGRRGGVRGDRACTELPHLTLAPANRHLVGAEVELVHEERRERRLAEKIDPLRDRYEYILIDCPPSLSLLTVNALVAADGVLVPIQCEYFALEGVSELLTTIERVKESLNPDLALAGVVATMCDERTNLSRAGARGDPEALRRGRLRTRRPAKRAPRRGAVLRQADPPLRRQVEGRRGVSRDRARAPAAGRPPDGRVRSRLLGSPVVIAPRKPALGKGLSALIPSARADAPSAALRAVAIDLLDANRRQPRRRFDDAGLEELSRSIRRTGILQPVLVTKEGGRFRIVAGERRVRAARLAGLSEVPVVVREGVTDRDHLLLALVENVQRRDLTALEEAEAYRHLKDDFSLTQEDVAERVGKDRATVANALRLLKLPAAVRAALEDGSLSAGHARALLALPSAADQELLAKEVVRRGLSVRATEARAAAIQKGSAKKRKSRAVDADTRDAELRLARVLGTRVEIRRKRRGGEVRISFFSEEELIGLFERLLGGRKT